VGENNHAVTSFLAAALQHPGFLPAFPGLVPVDYVIQPWVFDHFSLQIEWMKGFGLMVGAAFSLIPYYTLKRFHESRSNQFLGFRTPFSQSKLSK
jgi:hypothetical protein